MPVAPGLYNATNPGALFAGVTSIIERHRFFDLHLSPSKEMDLDGPDDFVAVYRCGTVTVLGSGLNLEGYRYEPTPAWPETDVNGPEWQTLESLIDDVQAEAFAASWIPEPKTTSAP